MTHVSPFTRGRGPRFPADRRSGRPGPACARSALGPGNPRETGHRRPADGAGALGVPVTISGECSQIGDNMIYMLSSKRLRNRV